MILKCNIKRFANRHAQLLHVLMAADKHLNYDTAQRRFQHNGEVC